MSPKDLINTWFLKWKEADYLNLPISEDFTHTSPYGTIRGRKAYIDLVKENLDKFLGHEFKIHDIIENENKACVRYTAIKEDFVLDVSEWHYTENNLINKIVAYYNIEGEISEKRKLKNTGDLR